MPLVITPRIAAHGNAFHTDIADLTDVIIQTSTHAGLPTPGTAGRLRRVSDRSRGIWMDSGTRWFSTAGEVINMHEFGAPSGGDDTAIFQAAHDALPGPAGTNGGVLYLPPAAYRIDGPVNITKSISIVGDSINTTFVSTQHATNDMFEIRTPWQVRMENFQVFANVTRTSGAAIRVYGGLNQGSPLENGHSIFRNLSLKSHFDGIVFHEAVFPLVEKCFFQSTKRVDIVVRNELNSDAGGAIIDRNIFSGDPSVGRALIWNSGGGLRFTNNGVVGYEVGLDFDVASTTSTADIFIVGNQIEGEFLQSLAIAFGRLGATGGVANIIITHNEFDLQAPGGFHIVMDSATAGITYYNVLIANNLMVHRDTGTYIDINHSSAVLIQGNQLKAVTGNPIGIRTRADAELVKIGPNQYVGSFAPRVQNLSVNSITIPDNLPGTVTIDPANITANTTVSLDVTIPGLKTTDRITFVPPVLTAGLVYLGGAAIPSANTARIYLQNTTGGAIDEPSGSWKYVHFDDMS
jgi:hypothetical protein